jgi:antitoxin (DNA-binding transcriptional repressor) of toxin-antitoxin stability system
MARPEQDKRAHEPQWVGVREFREDLSGFLRRARQGSSFLIMSRDQVLAEVRPPPPEERLHRRPGALRGEIRMAPDFDALPAEVLAAMEGGGVTLPLDTHALLGWLADDDQLGSVRSASTPRRFCFRAGRTRQRSIVRQLRP